MPIALTIAGSDSGGGAGIQADLKTFHQFGVFGTSVVTAVTAQNTVGVLAWDAVSPALVARQLEALVVDLRPAAVKSGMLGTALVVDAVADALVRHRLPNYVLDPVMVSTSGHALVDAEARERIAERLVPLAVLVTPNLDEAEVLIGAPVRTPGQMEAAGRALLDRGAGAVLIKGGHLTSELIDLLVTPGGVQSFTHPRLGTGSIHGTGCALSAAVAAGLALGRPLERAVAGAVEFVQRAIAAAPSLGSGRAVLGFDAEAPNT
jgi:hydroxymethylpyrimidine/phosphomethylpyrimidine kinase